MLHLRKLRQERKLTQLELSKMLQISASAIGMYEQGRREPDHDTLAKIADFFNVSTDYLLGRTDIRNHLLDDPKKDGHFAHDAYMQQTNPDVQWNPPPEFFTDPETGKLIEAMNISDTHKRIILASKDLSPEELNRIADLMETIAKSHRK
jgi:transcriptional regulator with XRE-family HTH domain